MKPSSFDRHVTFYDVHKCVYFLFQETTSIHAVKTQRLHSSLTNMFSPSQHVM